MARHKAQGNRVVTAIEVLSPGNKRPGPGRAAYLQKRDELWDARAQVAALTLALEQAQAQTLPPAAPRRAGQKS